MTEPTPLRDRLGELAAAAPDPGALDLEQLRGRIIRRRRGRLVAAGAAIVLTATTASVAAVGLLDQDASPSVAGETTPSGQGTVEWATPGPQQAFDAPACGEEVMTQGPAPETPLEMTVDLDDSVALDRDWAQPIGTATITNVSEQPFSGATGRFPAAFVVRDESVVTETGPQQTSLHGLQLAQGQSVTFPVHSFLRQCTPAVVTQPQHEPLEPGTYQVYVEFEFVDDFTLYSGPIDIVVE